jgi:putative metallohydrolase (TIGR04338 family)
MHDQGIDLTDPSVRLFGSGWRSPAARSRSARMSRLAKLPRRETQQKKMYDAEHFLFGKAVGTTKADVERYIQKITNYEWFRRRWGSKTFSVDTQRGAGGHGGYGQVSVGLNVTGAHGFEKGAQRNVVLHEMAHTLAQGKDPGGNWHGPHFARTMLELVRYAIGPTEAKQLRENFKHFRVKVASPTPLRAPENTPAPREVVSPKLWRVEYKRGKETQTVSFETSSMKGALKSLLSTLERDSEAASVTNVRIWRGVRQPTTTKKLAARKRPRKGS